MNEINFMREELIVDGINVDVMLVLVVFYKSSDIKCRGDVSLDAS